MTLRSEAGFAGLYLVAAERTACTRRLLPYRLGTDLIDSLPDRTDPFGLVRRQLWTLGGAGLGVPGTQ